MRGLIDRSFAPLVLASLVLASLVLASLALAGCGAKSALEAPAPPPIDASVDGARPARADAGARDASFVDARPPSSVPELLVVVTADNSYRFGFGDERGLRSTYGAAEASTSCQIFCCSAPCRVDAECRPGARCGPLGACEDGEGPEAYRVPEGAVTGSDYLYVIAWSDDAVTQGLLVEIRDSSGRTLLLSGDRAWSVCATNRNFDTGSGGPDDRLVAEWLGRCEGRWVGSDAPRGRPGLAVGEANDAEGGDFPIVCDRGPDAIASAARWMWFDERIGDGASAFSDRQPEFLIFRVPTRAIVDR